jgi:hypothetical protein
MDIQLSRDGYVTRRDPEARQVGVVVALGACDGRRRAGDRAGRRHIAKPIDIRAFPGQVETALAGKMIPA